MANFRGQAEDVYGHNEGGSPATKISGSLSYCARARVQVMSFVCRFRVLPARRGPCSAASVIFNSGPGGQLTQGRTRVIQKGQGALWQTNRRVLQMSV